MADDSARQAPRETARPFSVEVLPEGIVRAATFGDLDEPAARDYLAALQAAFDQVGEPLRILGDARRSGRHTAEARRLLMHSVLHHPPGLLAVVGAGPAKRLFVRAATFNGLVRPRFFRDEAAALGWLRAGSSRGPGDAPPP